MPHPDLLNPRLYRWRLGESVCLSGSPGGVSSPSVVFWGNTKVQSLLYHEEMDPSFPFSCPQQGKGTTIWRRAAVHGLGSGNMDKQTRGQLGSAYRTEAPRATGQHHGSKTGHTNSVSVFTELGRKRKKVNSGFLSREFLLPLWVQISKDTGLESGQNSLSKALTGGLSPFLPLLKMTGYVPTSRKYIKIITLAGVGGSWNQLALSSLKMGL